MTDDPTADALFDCECALHNAHGSHVDAWIAAAAEHLHTALIAYAAAHPLCVDPEPLTA